MKDQFSSLENCIVSDKELAEEVNRARHAIFKASYALGISPIKMCYYLIYSITENRRKLIL